ncbi:hypothetical protein FZX01_05285 [Listeria monocytogenes]|uniref:hypothetical protein n=1 Tax=Listeria monocytogenes TaxID=1639 RepID=UPI0011EA972D|nr:hypothetical protein [Listeria monocytogenes]TYU88926.1 hypothetical protein FZX01_05285 [Listeria monocytogenes]
MTLEMRELKGDDLFTLLAIVGKLDIKDDFVEMFSKNVEANEKIIPMDHQDKKLTKAQQEKAVQAASKAEKEAKIRGMEMAAAMLQKTLINLKMIKLDINELLADLTNTSAEEISNLGLKDYTTLLVNFFKKPELADFFSSIASLL